MQRIGPGMALALAEVELGALEGEAVAGSGSAAWASGPARLGNCARNSARPARTTFASSGGRSAKKRNGLDAANS